MDTNHFETMQVLLAIAILILAFGVGSFLSRYYR